MSIRRKGRKERKGRGESKVFGRKESLHIRGKGRGKRGKGRELSLWENGELVHKG